MSPKRWPRVEDLFHAALERAPEQRQAFLDGACSGDTELRRQVDRLLSKEEQAGSFLERPAIDDMTATLTAAGFVIGQQFGPYRIVCPLGAGGMGEVYRAHDSKLGRDVAIKTLPDVFARDPERLARFRREARTLASLNHPNIAAIYGLEESGDVDCLVLELVEGEPLRGPLPVAGALDCARQVAEALEAAHAKGIIHRDLKPDNVKVTPQGRVKVLDFGLAKAIPGPGENQDLSQLAAATGIETLAGHIVGTPGYMSPEQARAKAVDERTDIWAFGCLLYELLAGQRAFQGETLQDTIAAVLEREPDWQSLPAKTPARIRELLRHCLQKDADRRLHKIADARKSIEEAQRGWNRWQVAAIAAATLVTLALSVALWLRNPSAMPWFNASQKPAESLAVLPFVNAGGSPDTEYLGDGITEALINNLSQVPKLTVMSRNSVFRYKGLEADAQAAGRSLKVQAVLTGRVVQRGDNLSISTELIEVSNNRIIWGDHYNRRLLDILALQEEISTEISRKLRFKLSGEEQRRLTKRPTQNAEAYQFYLKGRYYWNKRTVDGFKKGIDYFQKAIDVDANYAPAYAGLADTYNMMGDQYGLMPPKEASAKAKAAAESARRIDDTFGDAHTALAMEAYLYEWDWPTADKEFKRALELDPSSSLAYHWHSHLLMTLDRPQQALDAGRRALELDPLDLSINAHQGWQYLCVRQYNEAIGSLQKTIDLEPGFPTAHRYLGLVYEDTGRFPDAIAEFEKTVRLTGGNTSTLALLGHAYAAANQGDQAQGILQQLNAMSKDKHVSSYLVGAIYAALGQKNDAFGYLKRAYKERDSWMCYLKLDRRLDGLRADRRFTDLLQRMNLSR